MCSRLRAGLNGEISIHTLRIYAKLFAGLLHGFVNTTILIVRDDADMRCYDGGTQLDGQVEDTLRLFNFLGIDLCILEAVTGQITAKGGYFEPQPANIAAQLLAFGRCKRRRIHLAGYGVNLYPFRADFFRFFQTFHYADSKAVYNYTNFVV
ncbi:hypothetical protein D3C77_587500 [compost metagenome]